MTKDELILAINNETVFSASYDSDENYFEVTWDGDVVAGFAEEASSLDGVENNFVGQNTDDIFILLCLINRYVNTPIDQRNWAGAHQANLELNMKSIKDKMNKVNQLAATIGRGMSDSPASKLPQHGVIITLDDGQELHGKRAYDDICISDFEDTAIDFGNFIIPTAIIRSIQKCGDGND